jgi:hypothetical protein
MIKKQNKLTIKINTVFPANYLQEFFFKCIELSIFFAHIVNDLHYSSLLPITN